MEDVAVVHEDGHEGVQWEEMLWAQHSVSVRGDKYSLVRIHFTPIEARQPGDDEDEDGREGGRAATEGDAAK